jgi:hypothetical protein
MKRTICLILGALLLSAFIGACGGGGGGGGGVTATGADDPLPTESTCETSTSFEFNATGPFCIGTSPFIATFSSGVTKSVGQDDLYSSGDFSWHVLSGTSATVTFETLPSTVTFFVRTEFMGTVSDIQILDENGDLITPVTPDDVFQQVVVNRVPGQTIIGSIVVMSISGGDVVIDDFIFVI